MKSRSIDSILIVIWLYSAVMLSLRIYSLRFNPPQNAFLFWFPYVLLVTVPAYMALTRNDNVPMAFTLGLSLVLHSINILRQPENINLGKDAVHNLQTAIKGVNQGYFIFGDQNLVGIAYDQSHYPGLELFMSSLHLITQIPLDTLYNFAFVPINILTLLFLNFFIRILFKDRKVANLSVFLYALCPQFHSFNSYSLHESLAIIFFPFMLSVFFIERGKLFRLRGTFIVTMLVSLLITITNEYTMYVIVLNFLIIALTYLVVSNSLKRNLTVLFLLMIFMVGWLFSVATVFIETHGILIENVVKLLLSFKTAILQQVSPSPYALPFIQRLFSYMGFGLLFLFSIIGIYVLRREEKRNLKRVEIKVLTVWWFLNLLIIFLFEVVPWQQFGWSSIRFRELEFTYFGIVPFSAIGINHIVNLRRKSSGLRWSTQTVSLILLLVIAVPTICVGFPQWYYDNEEPKTMSRLNLVEAYHSSMWLMKYDSPTPILGTEDGLTFISGYAAKEFLYITFKLSIKWHDILGEIYYINLANLLLPDESNFRIGEEDIIWLSSHSNKVYDNKGTIVLYTI